jgi:hypothetical protein
MIFYYFLWWLIWTAERLPNSFDSKPASDPNNPDPDNLRTYAKDLTEIYFFLAIDLFANALIIVTSDINWVPHSIILILYSVVQVIHIYYYFESTML